MPRTPLPRNAIAGKPLHYPAAAAGRYSETLRRMIAPMLRDYERELTRVFETHAMDGIALDASLATQAKIALTKLRLRFDRMFRKAAPAIVDKLFGQLDKASAASVGASLKAVSDNVTLKRNIPEAMREAIRLSTAENVALIQSIPQKYHFQIEQAVLRSQQPGANGMADLRDALREYKGVTERRVDLIATDQTRKATTAINAARVKAAGVKKFRWLHSGGGADPRPLHQHKLNGEIFSYDDPPVIDERTGERGLPGQLINCRCVAQPIITFGDDTDNDRG